MWCRGAGCARHPELAEYDYMGQWKDAQYNLARQCDTVSVDKSPTSRLSLTLPPVHASALLVLLADSVCIEVVDIHPEQQLQIQSRPSMRSLMTRTRLWTLLQRTEWSCGPLNAASTCGCSLCALHREGSPTATLVLVLTSTTGMA